MAATEKKRTPAHMEMTGGKGSRQRAWEQIRKYGINKGFTAAQLSTKTKIEIETLRTYLRSLELAGFLSAAVIATRAAAVKNEWKLIRDNGIEAPRLTKDGKPVLQGMGTEAMWRSMRIIGDFDSRELAAHASASGCVVKENTASSYITSLVAAGYLKVTRPKKIGVVGLARYRMAPGKNTGPRPPMIQRTKNVYDPNLGKVVWEKKEKNYDDL